MLSSNVIFKPFKFLNELNENFQETTFENISQFSSDLKLSSANLFSLEQSKICLFGKG